MKDPLSRSTFLRRAAAALAGLLGLPLAASAREGPRSTEAFVDVRHLAYWTRSPDYESLAPDLVRVRVRVDVPDEPSGLGRGRSYEGEILVSREKFESDAPTYDRLGGTVLGAVAREAARDSRRPR